MNPTCKTEPDALQSTHHMSTDIKEGDVLHVESSPAIYVGKQVKGPDEDVLLSFGQTGIARPFVEGDLQHVGTFVFSPDGGGEEVLLWAKQIVNPAIGIESWDN